MAPGYISNLEANWEEPNYARFLERLASRFRIILFDKRGTGLSDRIPAVTLEERADDLGAVMDAAGVERGALLGWSEGGSYSAFFAAREPERVSHLILYAAPPRILRTDGYPAGWPPEMFEQILADTEASWGTDAVAGWVNPSAAEDAAYRRWFGHMQRLAASPGSAREMMAGLRDLDIRDLLPSLRMPTLILHRVEETWVRVEHSRYLAAHIPGAKYVELPGGDHWPWMGDSDAVIDEIEEFVTGTRPVREPDRVLATVLFTDIVDSTRRAADLGDRRWRDVLERHNQVVRESLQRFRGDEVKTMGDGFLATFDGPARGIRCARTVVDELGQLGVDLRAGLHTGECEAMVGDLGGVAVHIGARVAAKAQAGEVLVSSTVKDLVAGSEIDFRDRGEHELKGVPGRWRLFAVASPGAG
ncbi:MAG TPA: alpha/beta fold hydrolase [Solirubrobacterales bacterium]|nr:alpha/beta fold hydrolase [Solirubrobacterales bacterium]